MRLVECWGGGWHSHTVNLPPECAERFTVAFKEPCGCVGHWTYELWGELALAAWYEPPGLHALTVDFTHPYPAS